MDKITICCSCKTDGIERCISCDDIVKSKCECEAKKIYIELHGGNKKVVKCGNKCFYICIDCFNMY